MAFEVVNRTFPCPYCKCFFFTEHDLALHLATFVDRDDSHKEVFEKLHAFVEDNGTEFLADNFCSIVGKSPEQIVLGFEVAIKNYFGVRVAKSGKFVKGAYRGKS